MPNSVPMATGARSPVFPLPAVTRRSWNFGHSRASGVRRHAGVDLYAPADSTVHAPEGGTLIAHQPFLGPQAVALLMQTDSGAVILFGEVRPKSWEFYDLKIGSRVEAGDPVGVVGVTPGGSSMLHFEMYAPGTRRNSRWLTAGSPPANLLNPTEYLRTAIALDTSQTDPDISDTDPTTDPDIDHDDEADQVDDEGGDDDDTDPPMIPPTFPPILPPVLPPAAMGLRPLLFVLGLSLLFDEVRR